jgi:hypothetical protein
VQLHVAFGEEKNKAREQTESFMLLRPSWSDPIERDKLRTELRKRVEDERRQMGLTSKKAP